MFTRMTCALKYQLFSCVSNIMVQPLMYTPYIYIHTYTHNVLGIFSTRYQTRNTPMIIYAPTWRRALTRQYVPPTIFLPSLLYLLFCIYIHTHARARAHTHRYTQKNGAVSKGNKKFISHLIRTQRTPSAASTVQVSHALPAVRFSCLLRGRKASFQDGVAAGKGFLCAPFWGVQICDYSAAVQLRCAV